MPQSRFVSFWFDSSIICFQLFTCLFQAMPGLSIYGQNHIAWILSKSFYPLIQKAQTVMTLIVSSYASPNIWRKQRIRTSGEYCQLFHKNNWCSAAVCTWQKLMEIILCILDDLFLARLYFLLHYCSLLR